MTRQDEQIKQLQQIAITNSSRLRRIESLFNFGETQHVSDETTQAMHLLQEYYQSLPDMLQEKLHVDLPTALEIMDELEDNWFINRNPIQEITEPEFVDDLFEDVCKLLITQDRCSPSQLQRHFQIGYNRAARIVDKLEKKQFISPALGTTPRKIFTERINTWLGN